MGIYSVAYYASSYESLTYFLLAIYGTVFAWRSTEENAIRDNAFNIRDNALNFLPCGLFNLFGCQFGSSKNKKKKRKQTNLFSFFNNPFNHWLNNRTHFYIVIAE